MFELKISYVGPKHVMKSDDDLFIDSDEEENYNKKCSRSILLLSSNPDAVFNSIVNCCGKYTGERKDELEILETKVKDFMAGDQGEYEFVNNKLYKCTLVRYPIKN